MYRLLFRKQFDNNEVRVRRVVEVSQYGEPDPLYIVERYIQGYGWRLICSTNVAKRAYELRDIWDKFLTEEGGDDVV